MRRELLLIAAAALGCSRLGTDPAWSVGADGDPTSKSEREPTSESSNGQNAGAGDEPGGGLSGPGGANAQDPDDETATTAPSALDPEANPDDEPGEQGSTDPTSTEVEEAAGVTQPGRLPLHHLTAAEYNTTAAQLLATDLRPADYFPASGSSDFDTNVGVLASLSPVLVQGYYDAAKELAAAVLASSASRAEVLDCDPASAAEGDEATCVRTLIEAFGQRAFRRPLSTEEVDRYGGSYAAARSELGMDQAAATQHLLRLLLSSPNFFLRVETLGAEEERPWATSFALASRLSYLLWSSGPDRELLSQAERGALSTTDDILREVNRMLPDARSGALVQNFVGQWLGLRRLPSHAVDAAAFPDWNAGLLTAMSEQADAFATGLFTGERRWADFLTAEPPSAPALDAVFADDPRARSGFLTLPAFLTLSSHGDRTAPTTRAVTILGGLLCTSITPPANVDIPDLSATGEGSLGEANIRKRLEQHREAAECAGCHAVLDPIGLSLENYDAIGHYRTHYGDGSEVDASGNYAGVDFDDVAALVPSIASDERYARCPVEKLTSYALRRRPAQDDRETIDALTSEWNSGSLDDLIRRLATHPMFAPQL